MSKCRLCFSVFLLLWVRPTHASRCTPDTCSKECRKLETEASKLRGQCTLLNMCECKHYDCDDSKCFQYCVKKNPEWFKGGHCRWDFCKCDTQAWRRNISAWIKRLL